LLSWRRGSPPRKDIQGGSLRLWPVLHASKRVSAFRTRSERDRSRGAALGGPLVRQISTAEDRGHGGLGERGREDVAPVVDRGRRPAPVGLPVSGGRGSAARPTSARFGARPRDSGRRARGPHLFHPAEGAEMGAHDLRRALAFEERGGDAVAQTSSRWAARVERLGQQPIELGGGELRKTVEARRDP